MSRALSAHHEMRKFGEICQACRILIAMTCRLIHLECYDPFSRSDLSKVSKIRCRNLNEISLKLIYYRAIIIISLAIAGPSCPLLSSSFS